MNKHNYKNMMKIVQELRVFRAGPQHPPSVVRLGSSELHPCPAILKAQLYNRTSVDSFLPAKSHGMDMSVGTSMELGNYSSKTPRAHKQLLVKNYVAHINFFVDSSILASS